MQTLWEHQAAGHLTAANGLLRTLGYAPEAVNFALDPASYFFPNIRGDMIVRPHGTDPDLIPVIGLEPGQTYRTVNPRLHSLQRMALATAGYSQSDIHDADYRLSRMPGRVRLSTEDVPAAAAYSQATTIGSRAVSLASRPLLCFNRSLLDSSDDKPCASVVMHELTHVAQWLSDPTSAKRTITSSELEAFAVQATMVQSFDVAYTAYLIAAGNIDTYRKRNLGEHTYMPDRQFILGVKSDPLMARILRAS